MLNQERLQQAKKEALKNLIDEAKRRGKYISGEYALGVCTGISEYERILKEEI